MQIPVGLRPYFRAIAYLGLGAMIIDTLMSAMFGATIGTVAMIGLAIVSLASGLFLVAAELFRRIGWTTIASVSFAVWGIAFAFNVWSNMGVATSTRMGEVQQATVQQTTYRDRQSSVEEAKQRLELFTKQLQELTTQHAWAATVTADGLRAQITDLERARASEAKLGGCGPKCRAIEDKIASVRGQIAVAEQRHDLTERIEATKRVLSDARDKLSTTTAGISATANQSTLYAKLIAWNLADDPDQAYVTVANEGTGVAMAVVIAIVSAFLTLVGALPHLVQATPHSVQIVHRADPPAPAAMAMPTVGAPRSAPSAVAPAVGFLTDAMATAKSMSKRPSVVWAS